MNNTSLLERCLDVIRNGGATYDIDECVKDLEAAIAEQKDPISHYARGFTDAMHRAEQAKPQEPFGYTSSLQYNGWTDVWKEQRPPFNIPVYLHPQTDEIQDFDKLAQLGWQAIECSLCGSSAMAFQVAQVREPTSEEQDRALCEAHCKAASDEYFKARPQIDDNATNRRIFYAGHRKAWLEKDTTTESSYKEIE